MSLTSKQRQALELYADGKAHNEKALRINVRTYETLMRRGYLRRSSFLVSTITDEGRAALSSGKAQ